MNVHSSFIIVKRWKQPKCSLTYKWINKMWYSRTIEYYSAIRRNEILMHNTSTLENIMLNEGNQTQNAI